MISTRRSELFSFFAAFSVAALVGCLDFSGAPCTSSGSCPNNQQCVAGTCQPGGSNTGGGTGDGGTHSVAECQPCQASGDCKAGLDCELRNCDGTAACFSSTGTCPTIAGVVCPEVLNFRECTSDTQCQAGAKCLTGRCLQACAHSSDCYLPADDVTKTLSASCVSDSTGDARCYPACASQTDAVCGPLASYCETFGSGSYGYCELGCGSCGPNGECAAGSSCFGRICDGLTGCYPLDGGSCPSISLTGCGAKNNFEPGCTDNSDCGALATCVAYGSSGIKRCVESCTKNSQCFRQSVGGILYPSGCAPSPPDAGFCAPRCDGGIVCPDGTTCSANAFCQ